MNASLFFPHLHSLFIVFFVGGLTLRNFGGTKLRITLVSIHAPTLGTTNTNNTPTNAFQSTPPRGRRPVQIMPVPTLMCFNPRPHTRGDSPHGLPLWLCSVSIHAPTRGATAIPEFDRLGNEVSIHAPTRGATQIDLPLKSITLFQSTPPRGGATQLA